MRTLGAALVGLLAIAGCATNVESRPTNSGSTAMPFTLRSDAFSEGQPIPSEYSCDGDGKQLPVAWSDAPSGTAEFALTMDDPDANGFVHWVVTGIPASATAVGSSLPPGATSGQPYRGPCPPSGTHRYVLTLYALFEPLGAAATTAAQVRSAATGKTLASAQLTGTYTRK